MYEVMRTQRGDFLILIDSVVFKRCRRTWFFQSLRLCVPPINEKVEKVEMEGGGGTRLFIHEYGLLLSTTESIRTRNFDASSAIIWWTDWRCQVTRCPRALPAHSRGALTPATFRCTHAQSFYTVMQQLTGTASQKGNPNRRNFCL